VDELLVDQEAMKVRYLDVDVDKELRGDDKDKHVLIPIGYAVLNRDEKRISVNEISTDQVRGAPAYAGRIDPQYESTLNAYYGAGAGAGTSGLGMARDTERPHGASGEERMTLSEEEMDISRRQERAGEARVAKHVETEQVREDVPVTREEVEIERRPIQGDRMEAQGRIEEDEVRMQLNEEHVEVHKRTVPREEIILRKRQVQDTETVETDLRREEADIRRDDGSGDLRDR
jgi:uncharacterized protein (TIGR02271 family)